MKQSSIIKDVTGSNFWQIVILYCDNLRIHRGARVKHYVQERSELIVLKQCWTSIGLLVPWLDDPCSNEPERVPEREEVVVLCSTEAHLTPAIKKLFHQLLSLN